MFFLLLPFCFLVICRRHFVCTYSYIHGLIFCVLLIAVIIVLLLDAAFECVACFVLSHWMDVNMNTIILRLHPTRGSPNNVCLVANAWHNCSTRSDMRSAFGIWPRERPSGKKRQVLCHFGPAGRTRGSREWPSGSQP